MLGDLFDKNLDSSKNIEELEQLLPVVCRCLQVCVIDKQQLHEIIKNRELELEQAHENRQIEAEQAEIRQESDKDYIMQIEHNYQNELAKLKEEKDIIVA